MGGVTIIPQIMMCVCIVLLHSIRYICVIDLAVNQIHQVTFYFSCYVGRSGVTGGKICTLHA